MNDDILTVRNVARYPLRIGKELVQPGELWSGERGFVMIAHRRYPGRLEFAEKPAPVEAEVEAPVKPKRARRKKEDGEQ